MGDYGIPGGAYFNEFRKAIHVIEPFVIPSHWDRYRSIDYGLDMTAVLWYAVDEQGLTYIYKELYQNELIVSEAAKRILEVNGKDKIRSTYAPPDLWNRRNDTGKSASEIMMKSGVSLYKSSNSRIAGWLTVKEWLRPYQSKDEHSGKEITTASIKIFKNCRNLIRTLPQLQCDERDPNDVAKEPHELTHINDSLRAYCIMRQAPTKPIPIKELDLSEWEETREEDSYFGGEPDDSYFTGG